MRFEVYNAVKIWIVVFWVVALHSSDYQCFVGTYRLHLQGRISKSSTLKIDLVLSSKTLVSRSTYKTSRCQIAEDHNPQENINLAADRFYLLGVILYPMFACDAVAKKIVDNKYQKIV
jgi:hypothetical protein